MLSTLPLHLASLQLLAAFSNICSDLAVPNLYLEIFEPAHAKHFC